MEITEYSKLAQKELAMFVLRKTILFFNVIFMRNIYLSTGIAALILLSGCNKDEYEGRDITGAKLTVYGTVEDTHTRVSNESWETTDAIGITLQGDNADGLATNIKYTLTEAAASSGAFTAAEVSHAIHVKSSNSQTFQAYYPYTGEDQNIPDVVSFNIADAEGYYTKHDFLYATATATIESPEVTFKFDHMMSKVALTFNNTTTTRATDIEIEYTLNNIIVDGTFDPQSGTVECGNTLGSITITSAMGGTSSVILPPQTTTGVELFIKVGEKYYVTNFDLDTNSKTEYKYDVNINETEEAPTITITGTSINPWINAGETQSLNPTEDPAETLPDISGGQWDSNGEITNITENTTI